MARNRDRPRDGRDRSRKWSPFAKAFHRLEINYLENVPLKAALRLRNDGRLQDMRGFLRKIWNAAGDDSFAEANVENLASELLEKVREAEGEWSKIDRDLLKWLGVCGVGSPFTKDARCAWPSAHPFDTGRGTEKALSRER